jgi:hypothetical protein
MGTSLLQHLHKWFSFETIPVNNIPNVETPLEFNSSVSMTTESPSHKPKANIFQLWLMFLKHHKQSDHEVW